MKNVFCNDILYTVRRRAGFESPIKKNCMGLAAVMLFLAVFISRAFAADFQIQPTTLVLGSGDKSGAFSVINSGDEKIDFQVSAKEWSQDAPGKDVYEDTKDIVFFPKIMTVDPHGQRAIRIGIKAPAALREKTYRLFVEEIPTQKKPEELKGAKKIRAGLTIAFRFAVPIFVMPLQPKEGGVIENVTMSRGAVKASVRNTGNVHIKLHSVTLHGKAADGTELFSKEFAGWYILQGLSRSYETAVPQNVCGKLAILEVKARAENLTIDGTLNVQKKMCAP
jgi:fimbrial chaperone protein